MREGSWVRGALLSVLFFALMIGGAPTMAAAEEINIGDVITVIGKYIPVPKLEITQPPTSPFPSGIGPEEIRLDFINEAAMDAMKESIKAMIKSATKITGDTPDKFCSWYDDARNSKLASATRIGIGMLSLLAMWMDLTENELFGKPSLKNAELKKMLGGLLGLFVAGGHADQIFVDFCNLTGNPIF